MPDTPRTDPCPMPPQHDEPCAVGVAVGEQLQHCAHHGDGRRPCCLCGASPR